MLFASGLQAVNAALAAWWLGWGQCCSELALAAGGSARVFRSCGFTERTAWLHRWQIIERVEKSKECSPAHDSLLKNAHHALSLPAKAPEENVCSLHICHSCWATYYPQSICSVCDTLSTSATTQTKPPAPQMWVWPELIASFAHGSDSKNNIFTPEVQC